MILEIVAVFIVVALTAEALRTKLVFLFRSNLKYRILNALSDFIYYGPEIGVDASLALDRPSPEVLACRRQGQDYLAGKLAGTSKKRGDRAAARMVDPRFSLPKMLMPLLRELEFPYANFVESVHHREQQEQPQPPAPAGMPEVVVEGGHRLPYVGADAVQTLGAASFLRPVQAEIDRRMAAAALTLQHAPISLNPELERNQDLILSLTGMDQVRYCLSGSEAVDAALKDTRATTGKHIVVRFQSAYHGHVSGVDFLTSDSNNAVFLQECSEESLDFIERYHYKISAVIVNPMQHFTGINKPSPPGEKLSFGARRRTAVTREAYARWLHSLQLKCNYCTLYLSRVALILDDIYFAFRTPELFSSRYFTHPDTGAQLRPDVMVIGKGVAAGYPLSMVLGRRGFLNTYDRKYLLKVNKTVGTLSAWRGGIVASNVFLEAISGADGAVELPESGREQLAAMARRFDAFSERVNRRFKENATVVPGGAAAAGQDDAVGLPLRLRNFTNTFTFNFLSPSLYNSRYTQYLLAEGVYLSNYTTGKFNLSADATVADLDALADKFVAAAVRMRQHGYFEPSPTGILPRIMMAASLLCRFALNWGRLYYDRIMLDKHIDIQVSHNHPVNKFGHFWSSVGMILLAYPYIVLGMPIEGCAVFFVTHAVRQGGHFFYEKQDSDIEKRKFGHKDGSKKAAVVGLAVAAAVWCYREAIAAHPWVAPVVGLLSSLTMEQYVSLVAIFTIVPHFVEIVHQQGLLRGVSWALKILTDPFTDLLDFYHHAFIHPKCFLDLKDQTAKYRLDPATKKVEKIKPQ